MSQHAVEPEGYPAAARGAQAQQCCLSAPGKGGGTLAAKTKTEAEPELTRFDRGPELGSIPAQTAGLPSGWNRPSPEINARPVSLARGPQGGQAGRQAGVPKPPRAFARVPGEGPRSRAL